MILTTGERQCYPETQAGQNSQPHQDWTDSRPFPAKCRRRRKGYAIYAVNRYAAAGAFLPAADCQKRSHSSSRHINNNNNFNNNDNDDTNDINGRFFWQVSML